MTWPVVFPNGAIDLHVRGRIDPADAARQLATAREILKRLEHQPGVVLADEVGMGKTFVALAVAVATAWADEKQRPVVVMVPAGLKDKWPTDYKVFLEQCVRGSGDSRMESAVASNGLDFFRILTRRGKYRPRLVFLTHGALSRNLDDPWVKFAVVKAAMKGRHLGPRRDSLPRFAAAILQLKSSYRSEELYRELLQTSVSGWNDVIERYGPRLGEVAVPQALVDALDHADDELRELGNLLYDLPIRASSNIDGRIVEIRRSLNEAFQRIWRIALKEAQFRSPLVVLDEAHHLKNPATKLASLFVTAESEDDAKELDGALEGGFERMLFLTATPFQLGHEELLNVLGRFGGVRWKTLTVAKDAFTEKLTQLRSALDEAQHAALALDETWSKLRPDDLGADNNVNTWWKELAAQPSGQPERAQLVWRAYSRTDEALRRAEKLLQPWVVRHLRSRVLPESAVARRVRLSGDAVITEVERDVGLPVTDGALLPFMLAARAQSMVATVARERGDVGAYRATFAEGLASSFEAYLETRKSKPEALDEETELDSADDDPRLRRYLARLTAALPDQQAFSQHPKIAATVRKVVDLWEAGEKVVVFCHYRVTGRTLVSHISDAINARLTERARGQVRGAAIEPQALLESWDSAFDRQGSLERVLFDVVTSWLAGAGLSSIEEQRIADVVRRFVRTPLFLLRYVDLAASDRPEALRQAFARPDASGSHLGKRLDDFVRFMVERCTADERDKYLEALERLQPGGGAYEHHLAVEHRAGTIANPTVRLASGAVPSDSRVRLLRAFNTPFLPEVLVASSVMAEGVDLHLACRHMIHHDLSWNPSTIEQRTGRVDRIGAKAERVGQSIRVYLPYVGGTQDEKMYRVVMDRERWFQVVMGENYRTDELSTTALASRVPLPDAVCRALTLRLEVHHASPQPQMK